MNLLEAVVLGVLQGLGEFLPISSSAHLLIAPWLFGWQEASPQEKLVFDVALHLGTTVAVIGYFRQDLWRIFSALFRPPNPHGQERRLAWTILLACVPGAAAGALFEDIIEQSIRTQIALIAVLLMVMGLILYLADRFGRRERSVESLSVLDGFLIGCAQALALIPGVSRSGATITAGLMLGFTREAAARFSFLLSAPITLGATLWTFRHLVASPPASEQLLVMATGVLTSGVVGYLSIAFLLRYLRTHSMNLFLWYRLALGLL
ncbi:MAG: undecaprenyl-diphosphatase UppP, partial [Armatimonadota bacterium]|nr:undecaprenyl-diphosphatase UppP [Armatimonadota bacterium]